MIVSDFLDKISPVLVSAQMAAFGMQVVATGFFYIEKIMKYLLILATTITLKLKTISSTDCVQSTSASIYFRALCMSFTVPVPIPRLRLVSVQQILMRQSSIVRVKISKRTIGSRHLPCEVCQLIVYSFREFTSSF